MLNAVPITKSQALLKGPGIFGGLLITAAAVGDYVKVYDGLDDGSGKYLGTFRAPLAHSFSLTFPWPVRIERGLYIKFYATTEEVIVLCKPVSE